MFAERFRQLREENKVTQAELARVFNTAPSTISMYEQGRRTPPAEGLEEIADYFNVSVDYLLGRTDLRKPVLPADVKDIAFHLDVNELTDEGRQKVLEYIELMKLKYKKK